MNHVAELVSMTDNFVWGPVMLTLLVGTGFFLTIRCRFLPWKNLPWAIRKTLSKEARRKGREDGDVSPFSALTTALAATIGTGNIVGVATAMVSGGPGALVWMWISACFGLSSKFAECMLSSKYREVNEKGEISGGPMYTIKNTIENKRVGMVLSRMFALFAVLASFGIGNMTQGNSISGALHSTFGCSAKIVGLLLTLLSLLIIMGGIKTIAKVSSFVVPFMAVFYVLCGLLVIIGNAEKLPEGLWMLFHMAFGRKATGGALCGTITASAIDAARFGIARGVFSNEAGMGSAGISAAAAATDHPVRQGYISMTGTFWDTFVVCTITGLAIACSGVLGQINPETGTLYEGVALTIAAFSTVLGRSGEVLITVSIVLFAFSTILGWEYHGEKAFEYLTGSYRYNRIYRLAFSLAIYVGAVQTMQIVWGFSDIANALMAVPNLICLLLCSGEIAKEIKAFEKVIEREEIVEKARKK